MFPTLAAFLALQHCGGLLGEAPGTVIRPTVVVSGLQSGPKEAGARTVRTAAAWKKARTELAIPDEKSRELESLHGPLGGMDWRREMLVVVGGGLQPSGGYEVEPWRITRPAGATWKFVARLVAPGPDEMVTMAMTTPWVVVRIPALPGEPAFYIERAVRKG